MEVDLVVEDEDGWGYIEQTNHLQLVSRTLKMKQKKVSMSLFFL